MWIFDIFKINKYKKEIEFLKSELKKINLTKDEVKYINLKEEINLLILSKEEAKEELKKLELKLENLKKDISYYDDELNMCDFGLYKNYYNFENSEHYKNKLDEIKSKQREMVSSKTATNHSLSYLVDSSEKKGKEFILDTIKLSLKAFNNECTNHINKVKFNNVINMEEKIKKSYEQINSLTDMQHVSIKKEYLNLKINELHLKYEYECKKQEEKEEQQAIKERMKEELLVQKEMEKELEKLAKEEKHFENAKLKLLKQLETCEKGYKYEKIIDKIKEIDDKMESINQDKHKINEREKNTRAGYVYVISNIGSFGDDVYKIGMTRRLDPMDRVKELGNASVPFNFDVHAMIFSYDAPELENKLHKRLSNYQINKINPRKEFFKVNLVEVEDVVKEEFKEATIEFTKIAAAEEYRKSLSYEKELILI